VSSVDGVPFAVVCLVTTTGVPRFSFHRKFAALPERSGPFQCPATRGSIGCQYAILAQWRCPEFEVLCPPCGVESHSIIHSFLFRPAPPSHGPTSRSGFAVTAGADEAKFPILKALFFRAGLGRLHRRFLRPPETSGPQSAFAPPDLFRFTARPRFMRHNHPSQNAP